MEQRRRNWVEEQGGLPRFIDRIARHLMRERGMEQGHAIAVAVNAAKKMCRDPVDQANYPGIQKVNFGSRAEACAAVARWEAMKAAAKGRPSPSAPPSVPEAPVRPTAPPTAPSSEPAEPRPTPEPVAVTAKPWDPSPARFTDEQYRRSAVLDRGGDSTAKERYWLLILEPDGTLNRNAVRAAAVALSKVTGVGAEAVQAAARRLVAAYGSLGEPPPGELLKLAEVAAAAKAHRAPEKTNRRDMADLTHDLEQRTIDVDVEDLETRGKTLVGYAAVYGVESHDLGGYREKIAPGAFADVLGADVRCLLNHDPSQVLGRTRSGTLRLHDEERGLRFECDLPESPLGENVREAVRRKDVDGASFRFKVADDEWDGELRTVTRIAELHDVTVATYGAYDAASVELRTRPTPNTEEDPVKPEDRDGGGGLAVEDRAATAENPDVEARVHEFIGSTQKGESRSLTLTSGDAITPPQLSSYLWDRLAPQSVALRSGIRVIPTDRKTISWPQVVTDPAPEWVGETELIPATDPTFVTLEADPKKLAARTEFSNEVLDDSEPEAEGVVRRLMQRALALKLDIGFFQGNPSADDDSIRGLKFVSGIQSGPSLGANGAVIPAGAAGLNLITDAVGMLEDADVPGPFVIVMRPSVWRQFTKLVDDQGHRLLGDFSKETPNIDGHRIFTSNQLAANETKGTSNDCSSIYIYSVEPDVGPALVRRKDVEILLDRSRLFDTDQSEMRAKTRVDLLVPQPLAVLRIEGVRPA